MTAVSNPDSVLQNPTAAPPPTLPTNVDLARLVDAALVPPGTEIKDLHKDYDASRLEPGLSKEEGLQALAAAKAELFALQDKFYAESGRSMLIVLQGIDAAGKDGTIAHIMDGVNPEGVDVYGFKEPSAKEMAHDYLWRHELVAPELGKIAIFNRSHYENVLVTRVHPNLLWPKTSLPKPEHIWKQRYREINNWEQRLTDQGTVVVKFFLHLSRKEQGKRFLERIDDPLKNWKVSPTDMTERGYWKDYTAAFTDMLNHTSTDFAPWYVLPADHKWFSHLTAVSVVLQAMKSTSPHYPNVDASMQATLQKMKQELEEGH